MIIKKWLKPLFWLFFCFITYIFFFIIVLTKLYSSRFYVMEGEAGNVTTVSAYSDFFAKITNNTIFIQ